MESPELDGTYNVTDEQIKFYDENGFAFLNSVLTVDEVNSYRKIIDETVESLTKHDKRSLAEKTPYEREFLQCSHLWREFSDVRKFTLSKRLGNIVQQFFKADHVRLWHDQALYKVAGGAATQPHQDLAYWPMIEKNLAGTIWLALDEVTVDMGALYFIPGSHKSGIFSHDYIIENSIEGKSDLLQKANQVIKKEPITYNLKPGDATFHHALTVHYTGENKTNKTRKGMTVIYFADGVRFDGKSPAADHHCAEGSIDGQPIATKWNPIII
jgi:ectoine hydroxylase-related dioxygenase (phytanoyl-CoA dioxygenase family)